jgi:hypothetical protein
MLNEASFGGGVTIDVATLGIGFAALFPMASGGSPTVSVASLEVSRLRRRDARRRFSNVVYYGVPRFIFPRYGFLWRRREESRPETRRQFYYFVSIGVPWPMRAKPLPFFGVATLDVGFPASCPTAS